MDIQEIKEKGYIMFEAVAGSVAYCLNTPESDIDIRGIFKIPNEMHLALSHPPQEIDEGKQDIKYFELKKFFSLAAELNPNIVEIMWTPQDCIKICTPLMQKIINNRDLFISKKAYFSFSGYAWSQIKKASGRHKLINNPCPKEPPKKEDFCWIIPDLTKCFFSMDDDAIDLMERCPARPIALNRTGADLSKCHVSSLEHVSNTYRLYHYGDRAKGVFRGDMLTCESIPLEDEKNLFVGILIYNEHEWQKALTQWKQYNNWVDQRSEARWKLQVDGKLEYDQKNMMHTFRLLYSGKNILTKGEPIVRFDGEQREFLMNIRKGKYDYKTLIELAEKEMKEMEALKETSTIPHSVNMNKINDLYMEIIQPRFFYRLKMRLKKLFRK